MYFLAQDGNIVSVTEKRVQTGGIIWNGDGECFNAVNHTYVIGDAIDQITAFDSLENLACQIVATFQ